MSVKTAIKILDWWISHKKQSMNHFKKEWKFDIDSISEVAKSLIQSDETAIYNLEKIKKELVPNCKHPKNMRDNCNGVEYCMSCNFDL